MDRNICITIPTSVDWKEYEKELNNVENYNQVMNFKCGKLPAKSERNSIKRCYVCYNGQVVGWQKVVGFKEDDSFDCTTTGQKWKGNFIMRSGPFHKIEPIPMKGFRGFRYVDF